MIDLSKIPYQNLEDFRAAIRSKFVDGSATDPGVFEDVFEFISDQEFDSAGNGREAIAEAFNWQVRETQAGYSKRVTTYAALLKNEDSSVWQGILSTPLIDEDGRARKYETPQGNGSRAFLPTVNRRIRKAIAQRYKCEVPPSGSSFWDWVELHPEIPIHLHEGAGKSMADLSLGYVAIAVYGINSGYSRNDDGTYELIPDLQRFCQPGREFLICFDKDEKPETIKKVANATRKTGGLLSSVEGVSVRVASWRHEQGKGADDFIVANGADAWHEIIKNAPDLPMQALWKCLSHHQHQIGKWASQNVPIDHAAGWIAKAKRSPNVVDCGLSEDGKSHLFREFQPVCDFNFTVVKELRSPDGGGLMLQVEHVEGSELTRKEVYIKSVEISQIKDFVTALKRELKQNVSCTLKVDQLQALIQNRTGLYRLKGGQTYHLADRTGQQDDGTWMFENCQFAADGLPTTEHDSGWVFNHQLGQDEKIPSPKIASQNPEALKDLIAACQDFFNAETLPSTWFVCGYSVATMQRQAVMQAEGNFPQLALFGDPGGSKTTGAQVATSLAGMHKFVISRFSESMVYETVKSLGSLPLLLDDPVKKGAKRDTREAIDNFLWSMFNGTTRKVRGNEQTPHSNVIVTTNVSLGEDHQALESRLIKLHFAVKPPNSKGYPALKKAMDGASGGLSQLLAIAYDPEAVKDIEARLLEHLPHAHARISSSLALVTYFTQKFADTTGIVFDAFAYCVSHLCPTANEFESDKDSLQDFLEKLEVMKSEGAVGEWNLTPVTSGGKRYLAVYLAGVWAEFDRRFNPNYSRQSLQQLVEGRGGQITSQKFVATKLEWIDYERAIAEHERNTGDDLESRVLPPCRPKKSALRKCLLIPESEVTSFLEVPSELPSEPEVTPKVTSEIEVTSKLPQAGNSQNSDIEKISEESYRSYRSYPENCVAQNQPLHSGSCKANVGDRIRHDSQIWKVTKIRADGTLDLDLDHATALKSTSANPTDVELVEQGVAA